MTQCNQPQNKDRISRVIRWIAVVMVLVVSVLSGFTFSAFISNTNNSDLAQVALYAADASFLSSGNLYLNCNTDAAEVSDSYIIAVTNTENDVAAQVTVKYDITLVLSAALPDGITVDIDGVAGTASGDRTSFTFSSDSWSFAPGVSKTNEHTMKFTADPDVVTSNTDNIEISVDVHTWQAD